MKKVKEIVGLDVPVSNDSASFPQEQPDTSYLRRHAGLGTVATSMRGLLSENDKIPQRKKLLGE
ncbi:MAG: hypothetical protein ILP11_03175 [Alphaproteobacteria bacterium]|nr:hypothetical protein [Alphaproteobacteria bacterium]